MSQNIIIKIDGKEVEAREGEPIIDVAARLGLYIPRLCHYDGMGSCLGTCRVCTIKWKRHPVAACTLKAEAGMDLRVDEDELNDIRKGIVELLFVEGNHFCPGCEKSGDCQLQALAYRLRMHVSRFHYRFTAFARNQVTKKLMLDQNRCILCKRCTHKFKDQDAHEVFYFSGKGTKLRIEMDVARANALDDSKVDEVVSLCPVGAILKRGKGFDRPYGQRSYDHEAIGDPRD